MAKIENYCILGGGIAGLSFASFINNKSIILEKNSIGGLCRSFYFNGIYYDIGPHIIFSKNTEILSHHTSLIKTNKIRRSNKIYFKNRYIKYPFENDLYSLPKKDRNYCLTEFLNNPYKNCQANNMLQFFLKTFGEGITRLYLQPYNEKIWKFDPSMMDIQMVERIPQPPTEDVIKSAKGIKTEGYKHQLFFHYPEEGGFQTLINAYYNSIKNKSTIIENTKIKKISHQNNNWIINTDTDDIIARNLINTIPLHELFKLIIVPGKIRTILNQLIYNSIHIVMLQYKKDNIGKNFALYFPDKNILFHRLSKLNFLGVNYSFENNESALLAEITFRPKSYISQLSNKEILNRVIQDLDNVSLAYKKDLLDAEVRTFQYAYPIYDLNHRKNTDTILQYLNSKGIHSIGRFALFEYLNSDQVVEKSKLLATKLNGSS